MPQEPSSPMDPCLEPGSAPKDSGTEYNSNMTKDGAPGSHSALFGLTGGKSERSSSTDSVDHEDGAASKDKDDTSPTRNDTSNDRFAAESLLRCRVAFRPTSAAVKYHSVANQIRKTSPITARPEESNRSSIDEIADLPKTIESQSSTTTSAGQSASRPPPFSSLYPPNEADLDSYHAAVTETGSASSLATAPAPSFAEATAEDEAECRVEAENKLAFDAGDSKAESSKSSVDDADPPPPYTDDISPLESFAFIMAAAGGAASLITQVQQTGPVLNTLDRGHANADDYITLDLRGTRFTLSRAELEELPQFVLLYLFPSGGLPGGHMNTYHEGDAYPADYDPISLQFMLDFFNEVGQSLAKPAETQQKPVSYLPTGPRSFRAGIIILREDLDFYVIPPRRDIQHDEMIDVRRAAGESLLKQDGIFSGLRKSDEDGTTEQHLIEMLTTGGFDHDDRWGRRAREPNKAVICSLALARLRTNVQSDPADVNVFTMADKLSLFEKKPARRCWWEGVELDDVEGVDGKLKVWIRRVWTLETKIFRDYLDH